MSITTETATEGNGCSRCRVRPGLATSTNKARQQLQVPGLRHRTLPGCRKITDGPAIAQFLMRAFLHRGSLGPRVKANVDHRILFKLHFRTARDYVPASQKGQITEEPRSDHAAPTLLESFRIGFLAIPQLSAHPTTLPAPPAAGMRPLL
jgi:hypothetical protein